MPPQPSYPVRSARLLLRPLRPADVSGLPVTVTELRLFTGEHSAGNLRLYVRLGYRESRRQPTPAGYRLVHLAKDRTSE